jgi:hypothetical protein
LPIGRFLKLKSLAANRVILGAGAAGSFNCYVILWKSLFAIRGKGTRLVDEVDRVVNRIQPPEGAEIVFRVDHRCVSSMSCGDHASQEWVVPRLFVNGNQAAYQWLSDVFRVLATHPIDQSYPWYTERLHLSESNLPINKALSDEFECTLYRFDDSNRGSAMEKLNKVPRLQGSPISQMADYLRRVIATGCVSSMGANAIEDAERLKVAVCDFLTELSADR